MRIDRKLNLVLPIERDGGTIYVHSTPIGREVFERYFLPISKAFTAIYAEGLGTTGGPRVAAMMLRKISEDMGQWEGAEGVEAGLMNEIRRLSNVAVLGPGGWTQMPLQDAVDQDFFSEDERSEVENVLVFFMVASAMHLRKELDGVIAIASRLWQARAESRSFTDFRNSLPISTLVASPGETVTASLIPR